MEAMSKLFNPLLNKLNQNHHVSSYPPKKENSHNAHEKINITTASENNKIKGPVENLNENLKNPSNEIINARIGIDDFVNKNRDPTSLGKTNIQEMAKLKINLDNFNQELSKNYPKNVVSAWISQVVSRVFSFSSNVQKATDAYNSFLSKMETLDQKNLQQIESSLRDPDNNENYRVENLPFEGGLFTGKIQNGVPIKGTISEVLTPESLIKIKNESLQNPTLKFKVTDLSFNGGLYSGKIQNGIPNGWGTLVKDGEKEVAGIYEDGKYSQTKTVSFFETLTSLQDEQKNLEENLSVTKKFGHVRSIKEAQLDVDNKQKQIDEFLEKNV